MIAWKFYPTILVVILTGIAFGLTAIPIKAQSTVYTELLEQYGLAFNSYDLAKDEYIKSRSEYLQYQTLVSQSVAVEATQKFLVARQRLLISYLDLMKERLEQSPQLTEDELKNFIAFINAENDFLESQIPIINNADELDDLVRISREVDRHYEDIVSEGYRMKVLVIAGKIRSFRTTGEDLISLTSEQVARLRKEGVIDTVEIDRWLVEAPNRVDLAAQTEISAVEVFNKQKKITLKKNDFVIFQDSARKAIQYLKEANSFLMEIVHDIRFD